ARVNGEPEVDADRNPCQVGGAIVARHHRVYRSYGRQPNLSDDYRSQNDAEAARFLSKRRGVSHGWSRVCVEMMRIEVRVGGEARCFAAGPGRAPCVICASLGER